MASLSAEELRGLANTCGFNAANLINQAIQDAGTGGVVNSVAGALQLGTNSTDRITVAGLELLLVADNLTAHAGGLQTSALLLTGQINRVATVVTAADSVKLQPAVAGMEQTVINDGANSMQVFGSGTDTINGVATATGVAQAAGTIATYRCTAAGNYRVSTLSLADAVPVMPPSKLTSINVTTGTLAAGNASGAMSVVLISTNAVPGSQAMRTPAQVLADSAPAGLVVGMSYGLMIVNTGAGTFTLATDSGAGFTMNGTMTVPVNTYNEFVVTLSTATTGTVTSVGTGPASSPPPNAKFTSINVTTGTLAAGNASGAISVYLFSTNATPGSQAMRTPAQILADTPHLSVGQSYDLRIINTGAGTFTLATDSGAGFTMTGTMTVAQNTWRDFIVTINTATTGTVQQVGTGTTS